MVEMVYPLAGSLAVHLPFPRAEAEHVIFMSTATGTSSSTAATRPNGSRKNGGFTPASISIPPVDMDGRVDFSAKENIILSAARFDPGGNKQQLRMVQIIQQNCPLAIRGTWQAGN